MKTRYTLIAYYVGVGVLIVCTSACAAVIAFKMVLSPPCSSVTQGGVCVVDEWSVAGLTGSILGVAATVLAFLGAFAVAVWWAKLDERVSEQVNDLYKNQEKQINEKMEQQLTEQKTKMDEQFQSLTEGFRQLRSEQTTFREWTSEAVELQFAATLLSPPEQIEEIARQALKLFKAPSIAVQMTFKYLESVKEKTIYGPNIDDGNGNRVPNLLDSWNKALDWQKELNAFYPPNYTIENMDVSLDGHPTFTPIKDVKKVQEKIDECHPIVEKWKKSHNL